jgi:hypothetical protein
MIQLLRPVRFAAPQAEDDDVEDVPHPDDQEGEGEEEPFAEDEVAQMLQEVKDALLEAYPGEEGEQQVQELEEELEKTQVVPSVDTGEGLVSVCVVCVVSVVWEVVRRERAPGGYLDTCTRVLEMDRGAPHWALMRQDLQEQGRMLMDVMDYLQNPPEEGEEGADPGEEGAEGDDPPYPGEEGLQELWKEVTELCNEEDIDRHLARRTRLPAEWRRGGAECLRRMAA